MPCICLVVFCAAQVKDCVQIAEKSRNPQWAEVIGFGYVGRGSLDGAGRFYWPEFWNWAIADLGLKRVKQHIQIESVHVWFAVKL